MANHAAEGRGALTLLESLILLLVEKGVVAQEDREEVFGVAIDALRHSEPPDDDAATLIERIRDCGDFMRREG